jgi:hypothetical protein
MNPNLARNSGWESGGAFRAINRVQKRMFRKVPAPAPFHRTIFNYNAGAFFFGISYNFSKYLLKFMEVVLVGK